MGYSEGSQPPLRVGLVGAGSMGRCHARIIESLDRSRLVAVADPDDDSAAAVAEGDPNVEVFSRLGEMLDSVDIDVVHVCSPPALHFEHARAALEAGANVYVEKPFTSGLGEARTLLELASSRNLRVCAGHQLKSVFAPSQLDSWLTKLGHVCHVESHFHFRPSDRKAQRVRADQQLLDVLPHPAYLLFQFLTAVSSADVPVSVRDVTVGPRGTVHAMVAKDELTGVLHLTLEGRPVDSTIRLVGDRGTLILDYVRGSAYFVKSRGGSAVGKILNPLSLSAQLTSGTVRAGLRHLLGTTAAYPGLKRLIRDFHDAVQSNGPSPVSHHEIRHTAELADRIRSRWERERVSLPAIHSRDGSSIVVMGGTGFLGHPTVKALAASGNDVRAISRRGVPPWDRVEGVEYVQHDLTSGVPDELFSGAELVVHAAAATSGGWEAHRRGTVEVTEDVVRRAAGVGVPRLLYISSMAVLDSGREGEPLSESSRLLDEAERAGPYAWGKTEAERVARALADELSVTLKIVRPGPVVDESDFEPPGRLGRRIGALFFAVGSGEETLGVVGRQFAARMLAEFCADFEGVPSTINLISPDQPTKEELVRRLQERSPELSVVWIPRAVLKAADPLALFAQRVFRSSGKEGVSLTDVFRTCEYDTSRLAGLVESTDSTTVRGERSSETLAS